MPGAGYSSGLDSSTLRNTSSSDPQPLGSDLTCGHLQLQQENNVYGSDRTNMDFDLRAFMASELRAYNHHNSAGNLSSRFIDPQLLNAPIDPTVNVAELDLCRQSVSGAYQAFQFANSQPMNNHADTVVPGFEAHYPDQQVGNAEPRGDPEIPTGIDYNPSFERFLDPQILGIPIEPGLAGLECLSSSTSTITNQSDQLREDIMNAESATHNSGWAPNIPDINDIVRGSPNSDGSFDYQNTLMGLPLNAATASSDHYVPSARIQGHTKNTEIKSAEVYNMASSSSHNPHYNSQRVMQYQLRLPSFYSQQAGAPVQRSTLAHVTVHPQVLQHDAAQGQVLVQGRGIPAAAAATDKGTKPRSRYSADDKRKFNEMVSKNLSNEVIAAALNRTVNAISIRRNRLAGNYNSAHASDKLRVKNGPTRRTYRKTDKK